MTPITTTADLAAFCDRLKSQPFVAVDTEFMRETTYWPKLCLIQAAAPGGVEAVIDPLADGLDLLEDRRRAALGQRDQARGRDLDLGAG